ncbi:MAG: hypothetical protein ABL886_17035, partial [Rhodoglobus sp.]
MTRTTTTLTELAKIGFADLGGASEALTSVPAAVPATAAKESKAKDRMVFVTPLAGFVTGLFG